MGKEYTQHVFPAEALERLRAAGFECTTVASQPERVRALKSGCAALFERQSDGRLQLAQPPGYLIRGEIARLWDAGYQKFWLLGPATDEPFSEPRRPATADQLGALRRFSEELKLALELPRFYNESIGSVNEVTAYDRVRGRGSSTGPRPG